MPISPADPKRAAKDEWVRRVLDIDANSEEKSDTGAAWQRAVADCEAQANTLRALVVKTMTEAGATARMPEFEAGWALFSGELAGVTKEIDRGLVAAAKADPAQRGAILGRAVTAARDRLGGSFILSEVDDNDLMRVSIMSTLIGALETLERSAEEGRV